MRTCALYADVITFHRPSKIVQLQGCKLNPVLFVRRTDPTSRLPSAMIHGRRGSNASTVSGMTNMSGSTENPYDELFNHFGDGAVEGSRGSGSGGGGGGGGGSSSSHAAGSAKIKNKKASCVPAHETGKGKGEGEGEGERDVRGRTSGRGDAHGTKKGPEGTATKIATLVASGGDSSSTSKMINPRLFHDDDPDTEEEDDDDVDNDNSSRASSNTSGGGLFDDDRNAGASRSGRAQERSRSSAGDDIPKLPVRVDETMENGHDASFVSSQDTERAVSRVSGMQSGGLDMADRPPVAPESTVVLGDYCAPGVCVALSAVAQHPTLPDAVLHEWDQRMGVVTCRFYSDGRWVWVMTDDLLPSDSDGLLFAHTVNQHEFGVALIEKCFAVLKGSYVTNSPHQLRFLRTRED